MRKGLLLALALTASSVGAAPRVGLPQTRKAAR